MAGELDGLGKLAGRWLKAKKTELLTGNRREREYAEAESSNAQREMGEQISGEILMTAFPGLRRMKEQQEERKAAREADERAKVLALPRARVSLAVRGEVDGSFSGELPVRVEIDEDDEDGRAAAGLAVELVVVPDLAPSLGGTALLGLRFRVPGFHGPGEYDLSAIGRAREAAGDELDYTDFDLALGNWDETYVWTPDVGPGAITVGAGAQSFTVRMAMMSAGGELTLDADIQLPNP
jgi:hypothetical protein